jgi:endoglucanase
VVFTTQEEVGLRGAAPAAYGVEPDVAVAIDVTPAFDTPGNGANSAIALGAGPAIKVMDQGLITPPRVKEWMIQAAEKVGLPYQLEVLERGATDAKSIHLTKEGAPTGVLSVSCRYVHSPSEMVDWADVENSVRLLLELVVTAQKW